MHRRTLVIAAALCATAAPLAPHARSAPATAGPSCGLDAAPVVVERSYEPGDARTYDFVGFEVPAGTARVEVGYRWADHAVEQGFPDNPITQTVFDLGLWEGTLDDDAGLRGWGGSRQGRLDKGMAPVWVAADSADRGFRPGLITAGPWFAEIGVAAVGPDGATVHLEIACRSVDPAAGTRPHAGPVPAAHVADPEPGWYRADFHLHGYHSNPAAPDWDGMIAQATAAGLDIVPVTEYVTSAHWDELGAVQAAHPGVLLWPGREVITYFGHAIVLVPPGTGTAGDPARPHDLDHRHGHDGLTLGDIQRDVVGAGGLFGIAHPTIFPGPVFRSFCRGCEFELGDTIDWSAVTMMEVVTGPAAADLSDLHGSLPPTATPGHGPHAEQPFVATAVDRWEDRLLAGFKIAPVSGSDSKGVDAAAQRWRKGYGSSATVLGVQGPLTVANVRSALEAGRVYVQTRGKAHSPELALAVRSLDGAQTGTFGSTIHAEAALVDVTVRGGAGQTLRVSRNGTPVMAVPITADEWSATLPIARALGEEHLPAPGGSTLGTFWRVDTHDGQLLTTIGNAVFLDG